MVLHFRVGHVDEAARLVEKYHYSKRRPGIVKFACTWHDDGGLFGDYGECVAAAIFGIPGTRWQFEVMELTRLVKKPGCTESLTGLIAKSMKHLKRYGVDLCISFADYTQGHHGGIYQAASWNFAGFRQPRQDGLIVNGTFVPGRSCNSKWGTRSPSKLAHKLQGQTIEASFDDGKFLYWKALNNGGKKKAELLGLESQPYPKPFRQRRRTT